MHLLTPCNGAVQRQHCNHVTVPGRVPSSLLSIFEQTLQLSSLNDLTFVASQQQPPVCNASDRPPA